MVERIAIDASRASVQHMTGTEWYSFELLRAMAELSERPVLHFYHRSTIPASLRAPRTVQHLVRRDRLWTHRGLAAALKADNQDVLFVPSHVIPLQHPRTSIVTIHDLGYRHFPAAHTRRGRAMLELASCWNVRAATRIIAISGQTRDDLITHYHVPAEKIAIVHSAVNHAHFYPRPPAEIDTMREKFDLHGRYLFFLSTVQPRKNVERLVAAFEQLDDDLTLVIGGRSGWLSHSINERILRSFTANRVRRLEYVDAEDVPALYSGAAAFTFPSLYEGFGMGILEAMACGCPVVTSNISSMPEVAGGAAELVDPLAVDSIATGIEQALARSEELRALGLARAAEFTWDRTARETLSVIETAAADG